MCIVLWFLSFPAAPSVPPSCLHVAPLTWQCTLPRDPPAQVPSGIAESLTLTLRSCDCFPHDLPAFILGASQGFSLAVLFKTAAPSHIPPPAPSVLSHTLEFPSPLPLLLFYVYVCFRKPCDCWGLNPGPRLLHTEPSLLPCSFLF